MKEARAKTEARRCAGFLEDLFADRREQTFVIRIHFDIRQQAKVISGADLPDMGTYQLTERPFAGG
jgi:hypothetical protein